MYLRWLVGNWLKSEAAERARDAFTAAAETGREPSAGDPDEPPPPCHVGVVFALGIESGGLIDRLSGVTAIRGAGFSAHEGGLEGRRVVVVESGVGLEKAAQATAMLIAGHQPGWIISAGFAGSLCDQVTGGDIVIADSVAATGGERLAIDVGMPPSSRLHVGRLLSVDHIVRDPEEKRQLGGEHGAIAVDMETYAVAAACRQAKVRFMSVRAVTDGVEDRLPPEVENLVRQKTLTGRLGALTGSIWRRPSSVKDMWKLREDALVASDRLAKFLAGVIAQLVPKPAEMPASEGPESA